jgi:hypothetical protein
VSGIPLDKAEIAAIRKEYPSIKIVDTSAV